MTFVHTIADNETAAERRNVVMLADRYLRERAIIPKRIFTVTTREDASWNELRAFRATLASRAEEHMNRLERVEREHAEHARLAATATPSENGKGRASLLGRLFGRSR